jgi:signal transduction histidine kinase/CheY-like chemotaxis protein
VIAVPIAPRNFQGDTLKVCFMEMDIAQMLQGISMKSDEKNATFCNLYTREGNPLSEDVLGGYATEGNLLEALEHAEMDKGYSLEQVKEDFSEGRQGRISFLYNERKETLSYMPIEGTDWLLTYLIRESLISDKISSITSRTLTRSTLQSLLTVLALLAMFFFIIRQNRRNAMALMEKETAEAEARAKQEEMEQRLALQEELLAQRAQGEQQNRMIKALSSDYRSVYYLELDKNSGVCYQARTDMPGFKVGERFPYVEAVTEYCNHYVMEPYREDFLAFIEPDAIRKGLEDHLVISYRYMISVDGKESWEAVKFAGVRHPDEREDHMVHTVGACFVDVDEETRNDMEQKETLKDALETAEQANRAKTAFLSNMSHEIRTPMNAIIGLDNIALNDPETPEKTRSYLEKIGNSAEHLLTLINDILDMSRIESGRMTIKNEEFSFPELLETLNTMFSGQCADKGLDYQCHILGEVDNYYVGDSMKLRQVLINILSNAVKFTPEGGKVEFTVQRTAQFENQSTLRFTVQDNGIGMNKEFLPKLFEVFAQEDSSTTSKYGSSGLGMAITKNIVEMMNGNIQVESEKGKGSTFNVTVTLINGTEHEEGEERALRPDEMTVLIVDDDPVACEHAKLVLEKAGIPSEIAGSGPEAIEKVTLRHARRDPYNLILVDWKMPEMDGVETTRKMREIIGHESAIIILTAYRWDDVLEEALASGVDSFLPKPLFASSVMEEFRSATRRKGVSSDKTKKKADLTGRHILLAEDVEINAEIMMMVLHSRQMEAELAANGRIAVEMFASRGEGYYDAILMDMRMPEMDGLEATRRIRAMDRKDAKEIPIIALTANAFDEDVQRSLQAGLNAHLSKPVQPEALFETLESLIPADEEEQS